MRKLLVLFLFMVVACAPGGQNGASSGSNPQNFSIVIPEGWKKVNSSKYFIMTKEDAFSQYILVQQRHIDKPFKNTDKKLNKDMLPDKAAEVILNEINLDSRILNLQIMEHVPAKVNRYEGFRLVFTYKDQDGLKFKTIFYGLLQGNWFYNLRYSASETKYSGEDIETFNRVVASFKIKEPG
jgi:hypothetical protein